MGIPQVIALMFVLMNVLFIKKEVMHKINTVVAVMIWLAMLACAMFATFFVEGNAFEFVICECIWGILAYIGIGTGIELLKK